MALITWLFTPIGISVIGSLAVITFAIKKIWGKSDKDTN